MKCSPTHFKESYSFYGTLLHIIGIKLEHKDTYEAFIEVKEVVHEVDVTFSEAPNQEHGEDNKCQWFIVSIMRLVSRYMQSIQRNI